MAEKPITDEDITRWLEALSHPNATKRDEAAEELGSRRVSAALVPLIPLLEDTNDDVRASATFAVDQIADNLWEIPEGYYSGPFNDEIVAAHQLIKKTVIPKLVELLADPHGEV